MAAHAASGGALGKIPQSALTIIRRATVPALNLLPAIHTCIHAIDELCCVVARATVAMTVYSVWLLSCQHTLC